MLQKKNTLVDRTPFIVSALRFVHGTLILYAAAIIAVAFWGTNTGSSPRFTDEAFFATLVAVPMLLASVSGFVAIAVGGLFGTAIFFCAFVALTLAAMPLMTTMFFPEHLSVFVPALIYALSAIILARYYFTLPVPKKR